MPISLKNMPPGVVKIISFIKSQSLSMGLCNVYMNILGSMYRAPLLYAELQGLSH